MTLPSTLLNTARNDVCFIPHSKTPRQARYQHSSNIFAYPVKNKIRNLSKLLLPYWEAIKTGNLREWRFFFFPSPFKLTQEVPREVCWNCPATLTTVSTEKDHPRNEVIQVFDQLPSDHTPKIDGPSHGKPDLQTLQLDFSIANLTRWPSLIK